MKTIEINEQAEQWLIDHLNHELEVEKYSNTSEGIMRHLLAKLQNNE